MSSVEALNQAFTLHPLAHQLTGAPDRFRLLAGALFGRFFVEFPPFHFTKRALTLHFFLKRFKGLLDIIVADKDLNQGGTPPFQIKTPRDPAARREKPNQLTTACFLQTGEASRPIPKRREAVYIGV